MKCAKWDSKSSLNFGLFEEYVQILTQKELVFEYLISQFKDTFNSKYEIFLCERFRELALILFPSISWRYFDSVSWELFCKRLEPTDMKFLRNKQCRLLWYAGEIKWIYGISKILLVVHILYILKDRFHLRMENF